MYLDFGRIPHKVNMAANTIVSLETHSKHRNIRGGCRGMPTEHSLQQLPLNFQMGITLCYVLGFLLSYMQIPPWNHSLIMEIKPKHIYLPARLSYSSRLNICFLGCHHVSREPCATCSVSGRKMIAGKWEWRVFFPTASYFQWEFGGILACSLDSHCTVNKPETLQQKWLMSGSQQNTLKGVFWKTFFLN